MIEQMSEIEILQFQRNGTQREFETLHEISEEIEGSAENGPFWLGTDDPGQFLANYTRVGLLKVRILTKSIPTLQTRLEVLNQEIASAAGIIKFVPSEGEAEKRAREELIRKFKEDTTGVKFTPFEQKLIDFYRRELLDKEFVSGNVVMDYMWGEGVDRASKSNRLAVSHVNINKKLVERDWKIKNNFPRGSNREAQYFLDTTKKEEEEPVEETQFPVEVESKRPVLEIDWEKREIRIRNKSGFVSIRDNVEWGLFKLLQKNHDKGVTLYEWELRDLVRREIGINIPQKQRLILIAAMDSINSAFQEAFQLNVHNPCIVTNREGEVTVYKLNLEENEAKESINQN